MNRQKGLILIFTFLLGNALLGNRNLEVRAELMDLGVYHLLEPLFFKITVLNDSRRNVVIHSPETVWVSIREKGAKHWHVIYKIFTSVPLSGADDFIPDIQLKAQTDTTILFGANITRYSVFNKQRTFPGIVLDLNHTYEVKLSIDEFIIGSSNKWQSEIFSITFLESPEEYQGLLDLKYPIFYYSEDPEEYGKIISIANNVIANYPDSYLSDWARFYFFTEYLFKASRAKNYTDVWSYYHQILNEVSHPRIRGYLEVQPQEAWYALAIYFGQTTPE